jgi:hypothetical protein
MSSQPVNKETIVLKRVVNYVLPDASEPVFDI